MKDTKKKLTKAKLKKLERKERNKKDKEARILALARDNNECIVCGSKDRINVHHIIDRSIPEFRHLQENLICLCSLHHKWGIKEISPHHNPFIFFNWLKRERPEQLYNLETKWILYKNLKQEDPNRIFDWANVPVEDTPISIFGCGKEICKSPDVLICGESTNLEGEFVYCDNCEKKIKEGKNG